MIDKQKQIEDISTLVYIARVLGFNAVDTAEHLYRAGYRKQIDGEWMEETEPSFIDDDCDVFYRCSACGLCTPGTTKFCPECGAKMK